MMVQVRNLIREGGLRRIEPADALSFQKDDTLLLVTDSKVLDETTERFRAHLLRAGETNGIKVLKVETNDSGEACVTIEGCRRPVRTLAGSGAQGAPSEEKPAFFMFTPSAPEEFKEFRTTGGKSFKERLGLDPTQPDWTGYPFFESATAPDETRQLLAPDKRVILEEMRNRYRTRRGEQRGTDYVEVFMNIQCYADIIREFSNNNLRITDQDDNFDRSRRAFEGDPALLTEIARIFISGEPPKGACREIILNTYRNYFIMSFVYNE